ncbi:MAG: RsmG family class I SAM-dependent methyltransferase [Ilumatobacteraceae bacterium]
MLEALRSSQRLGSLGDRSVEEIVGHAQAFVDALRPVVGQILDLGSGGGVPGLVIAWRRPDVTMILVERRQSRADHLHRLVRRLGLADRVAVAAVDGRQLTSASADGVVARSFGAPAMIAELAGRLLRSGGRLVVSEPPHPDPQRWSPEVLRRAGLSPVAADDPRVFVATRDDGST